MKKCWFSIFKPSLILTSLPGRPSLPAKSAGQVCRPSLPAKSAGQVCRTSLPAKSVGHVCQPILGSQIGVLNRGPKSGSQIGVPKSGSPNRGPKSGSHITPQIRVLNRGTKLPSVFAHVPLQPAQVCIRNNKTEKASSHKPRIFP
jgi:hypothetical protein